MDATMFREYDIRGRVGEQLNAQVAGKIARGYGTYISGQGGRRVVVGRDVRPSSPELAEAVTRGLADCGLEVIDIGVVPTPVLYFAVAHYQSEGGVVVTASHNPPEFNGMKLCQGLLTLHGKEIQDVRHLAEGGKFTTGKGKISKEDVVPLYREAVRERIKLERPVRLIIDAGNGTAGPVALPLLRELGCEVTGLYCEPDGTFPNHPPDPTMPANVTDLVREVAEGKYELGVGYDGDGDRIGAIDEKGNIMWGDRLLALYAREILARGPATIIFDVKCSQALVEDIEKHGGRPLMWKTGHSLIKKKMKEEGSPLAGEMSGHMFFADNYYGYDDALFASCRLVELLSRSRKTLSELNAELATYKATPEIRIPCEEKKKFQIVKEVRDYFRERENIIDIDGVRVNFGDGWGLLRASNTQSIVVVRFEARSEERLEEIKEIFRERLRGLLEVTF